MKPLSPKFNPVLLFRMCCLPVFVRTDDACIGMISSVTIKWEKQGFKIFGLSAILVTV
jgi:hypothetical protein